MWETVTIYFIGIRYAFSSSPELQDSCGGIKYASSQMCQHWIHEGLTAFHDIDSMMNSQTYFLHSRGGMLVTHVTVLSAVLSSFLTFLLVWYATSKTMLQENYPHVLYIIM